MAAKEKQYHEELKLELKKGSGVVVDGDADAEGEGEEEGEEEESVPDAANKQITEDNAAMSVVTMTRTKRKLYEAMKVP